MTSTQGISRVEGIIELATALRGLGALSIKYGDLTVEFAPPDVRFTDPTPSFQQDLPDVQDEPVDPRIIPEDDADLMLTNPLAFEERVMHALQEGHGDS